MRVISIQSQVVYGHVGNSAAVFPLQANGVEVAPVPTALFSNHPHYPTIHGGPLPAEWLAGLLQGVEERGLVGPGTVILSGYLGSVANAEVVAAFIERALTSCPGLQYICDPVIGDSDFGIYVDDGLIKIFRDRLVPLASIITPNQFELQLLSGREARTPHGLNVASRALTAGAVVATGCVLTDTAAGEVETILSLGSVLHRTAVQRLPIRPCGTGDLFTANFVVQLAMGAPLSIASEVATDAVFEVLKRTQSCGAAEMLIIDPLKATA